MKWEQRLRALGLLRPVSSGVQLDITAGLRRLQDGSFVHATLCDHNCTTQKGHYTCPSATSANPGILADSLAPAGKLIDGVIVALKALRIAREEFLANAFDDYCRDFLVPPDVARCLAEAIRNQPTEVNITGGNPEVHPELDRILLSLKRMDDVVINLTTTGRRWMLADDGLAGLLESPPDLLCLSADAFESAEEIHALAAKSSQELRRAWESLSDSWGQKKKAIEAIFFAKQLKNAATLRSGFNIVVHPGNVNQIDEIIMALAKNFPGFDLFPYPTQTGFLHQPSVFKKLPEVERFIDSMLAAHCQENLPITRRLHYWLILKAALIVQRETPTKALDMIGGDDLWQCYRQPGAIRYLQIGKGLHHSAEGIGGGYLNCSWNPQTIAYVDTQVWHLTPDDVADYISRSADDYTPQKNKRCPGCGFPRLLFDVVCSEIGLNKNLRSQYLFLRKRYAGY